MNDFVQIREEDDVIVVLKPFKKGDRVDNITLLDDVPRGHKVALHDRKKGELLYKYGTVIGRVKKDIRKGEWVHSHNLETSLNTLEPSYTYHKIEIKTRKASDKTWLGYLRSSSVAGTRNDRYLVPTVGCVNSLLSLRKERFVALHPSFSHHVKILAHPYGCSQLGDDLAHTKKLLQSLSKNPNCGGLLVLGLGCENNRLSTFREELGPIDKERVKFFNAQDQDDEISYGLTLRNELYEVRRKDKRTKLPLSRLTLGVKCGGSDGFSGLTANPLLGRVSDIIGASGGKVCLTEVPERFGAEQSLRNRAKDEATYEKIVSLITDFKGYYARNNRPCYENPSPGNKDGGITTLEEKSNGCVLKGGRLEVEDVLDYGERAVKPGLSLVNGPGNDLVACTDLAAAGCNLICFTTGRGTPFGSIVPTLKIGTNPIVSKKKADWIDFNGGRVLEEPWAQVTEDLLDLILAIASGKEVKAERSDTDPIALFKTGVTL